MSPEYTTRQIGARQLGFAGSLTEPQLNMLMDLMDRPSTKASGPLSGRGSVEVDAVPGLGRVVVKSYRRGGWMRYFVRNLHLKAGPPRSQREFELLSAVRALGVNAPEPLAFAAEGKLFYKAWLVTREIEGPRSLAAISLESEEEACQFLDQVAEQISILINNGIFHIDLHPGNVIVDSSGKAYILDFDRALMDHEVGPALRDQYLWRWRRAVIKHGLPETLNEVLCLKLLQRAKE